MTKTERNHQIVVEGADGAGKSTLVARLARAHGLKPTHTGGPIYSRGELLKKMYLVEQGAEQLLDRTPHISNLIYASAEGRDTFLSLDECLARLRVWDPIIIYCYDEDLPLQKARISRDKKPHKSPEYLEKVLNNFDRVYSCYRALFHMLLQSNGNLPLLRVVFYNFRHENFYDFSRRFQAETGWRPRRNGKEVS